METTWLILFSIGIAQGLFLISSLLLLKDKRKLSVKLLLLLLLCVMTLLVSQWLWTRFSIARIPYLYRTGETIPLLIGPLFLLYARSVVNPGTKLSRMYLLHFVPFAVFFLLFLPYYLKSNEFKLEYIKLQDINGVPLSMAIFSWLKGLHTFVYLIVSGLYIRKHTKKDTKKANRLYSARLLYKLILAQVIGIVIIYGVVVLEYFNPEIDMESDRIASLIITFSFFAFAFVIILFPKSIVPDDVTRLQKQKYKDSTLSIDRKEQILRNLKAVLKEDKPHLNPELTIRELAKMLKVSPNQLSQVINELLNKNFYQFINENRIDEVKKSIGNNNKTLYGIALDCGFNSKSAFNRIFKEVTGMTPSQYKKII